MTLICKGCNHMFAHCACFEDPPTEHRGSRMPDLIRECAADPLFADAVFRPFTPEQAEMVEEKAGGRR